MKNDTSKRIWVAILLTTALITASGFGYYFNFRKIAIKMTSRSVKNGFTNKVEADIYYSADGKMVTYFTYPEEYVTMNNAKGELMMYDPSQNKVLQTQNQVLSSETSFFYFFLKNKKTDLGLSDMGFRIAQTTFEEGLIITEWAPPVQIASQIGGVKLVHDRNNPIFMSYKDNNGMIIKKTYYYDYVSTRGIEIPTTVTQIEFINQTDSIISKVNYSDIRLDDAVDDSQLSFQIPENATIINRDVDGKP